MSMQYQHTVSDLREIANLVDALEKFDKAMPPSLQMRIQGEIEVFWSDHVIGRIYRDEGDSWTYTPDANSESTTGGYDSTTR